MRSADDRLAGDASAAAGGTYAAAGAAEPDGLAAASDLAGYKRAPQASPAMRSAGFALAALMRAGMRSTPIAALPPLAEGATWRGVYKLAHHDSVEAITWVGLADSARSELPEELRREWQTQADLTLMRQLQFDVERERIVAQMEAAGLSWLALKGVPIASYYPVPGIRSMADNDILYGFVEELPAGEPGTGKPGARGARSQNDEAVTAGSGYRIQGATEAEREETRAEGIKTIVRIMEGLGYRGAHIGASKDDCFFKEPMFNFEMHRGLMGDLDEDIPAFSSYYANPWLRARRDPADPHRFVYAPADEYLYFLAHAYKHYSRAGCGVRFIADEWVYLQRYEDELAGGYLRGELGKLGLTEFDALSRCMAEHLFAGDPHVAPAFTEEEVDIWLYLLGCGTYGLQDNRVAVRLEALQDKGESAAQARAIYLLGRLFPSYQWCARYWPVLRHHKWLYPAFLVYRIVRGAVQKPGKILRELRATRRLGD